MDCHHAFYLAILQGLTEILPISSSGHLILVPKLLGWEDQGLVFDVAVHLGTLLAILLYYYPDIRVILRDWFNGVRGKQAMSADGNMIWYMMIATVPGGIAGLLAKHMVETHLRSPLVVATTTTLFGIVLWLAQKFGPENRTQQELTWKDALIIGCCQALALVPGTSRSGITITGGLFLGFQRRAAARFAFLISLPIIALAGLKTGWDLLHSTEAVAWFSMLLAIAVSAVTAYACIDIFIRILIRLGLLVFVVYRIMLGIVLFTLFLPA